MNNNKVINVEYCEARLATTNDLQLIQKWLKAEYDKLGYGFFGNWDIIVEAFTEKRMTVLTERNGNQPVAFAILRGEFMDILWVKPDMRRKGFGNKLVDAIASVLKKRRKAGILLTHVLDQSVDFWRKCGFCEVSPEHSWGLRRKESGTKDETLMMKIFDAKRRSVSAGLKRAKVQIEFLFDHLDTNQFEPYGAACVTEGSQVDSKHITLWENFTCLIDFRKIGRTRVRIRMDDEVVIAGMPLKEFCLENKINITDTRFFTMRSFHLGEKPTAIPTC